MMKSSMFNIYENKEDGTYLTYNMLTQGAAILDEETYNKMQVGEIEVDENSVLIRNKMIVSSEIDEKSYLKEYFEKANEIRNSMGLTICTTTGCNMKCSYCYEEGIKETSLTTKTIEDIINWLDNFTSKNNIHHLNLLLFGGEPLYEMTKTAELMEHLNNFGEKRNITLNYMVATNGVLLNKENTTKLKNLGLRTAQVTIDGPKDLQDSRRPLKTGDSGYDYIIKNMSEVADLIDITAKVNIDKENIEYVKELLNTFEENGIKDKIDIKFEAIAETPASSGVEDHHCSTHLFNSISPELAEAYHRVIDLADDLGFKVDKSTAHSTPCMYTSKTGLVIDSKGDIYKCISAIGVEAFKVGSVNENKFNERYDKAINFINQSQKCLENNCEYVPKCGSGCAYDIYCRTGKIEGIDCKKGFLKEYYSMKFNKIYDSIVEEN